MSEEKKFTEDELKQVQNFQQGYLNIQNQFGQVKLAQIKLNEQESEVNSNLQSLQEEEKKFLDGITKKYGEGSLNPETGVFTPNK